MFSPSNIFVYMDVSIIDDMYACTTCTLTIIFLKPMGWANPYFLVLIRPTDHLQQNPGTITRIDKCWSDQCQSNIIQQHTNNSNIGDWTQNHRLALMMYWSLRLGSVINKQNQLLSLLTKLVERFEVKSNIYFHCIKMTNLFSGPRTTTLLYKLS